MTQHERLGKYEIIDVLGRGAMGVVYKGFDPGIDRTVAIKTVRKELIEDDDRAGMALARFRNEARAAGRLSHPGIVAVYDYGESESVTYIAMEYVQGNSLREYFNRGARFTEADVVSVMAQLLEALQHAHEAGVWHRDIKPANLIIMDNGRLKIADFGIARIETSQLTQTGVVMGSPGYMAPEQYSGGTIDWRADLFACGVVMHQLLTGQRLFTGTPEQLAYKICHQPAPAPSVIDPGKGWERYDALLARALAKDPNERFASAAAFREEILKAYAAPVSSAIAEETIIAATTLPAGLYEPSNPSARTGDPAAGPRSGSVPLRPLTIPPPPQAPAQAPPAGARSRWPILVTAVLAVVVGVGIGGWLMRRPPASPQIVDAPRPAASATQAKATPTEAKVVASAAARAAETRAPSPAAPVAKAKSVQPEPQAATPAPPAPRSTAPARKTERKTAPAEAPAPKPVRRESQRLPPTPAPDSRTTESVASPVGAPAPPKPAPAPAPEAIAAASQSPPPQTAALAPAPAPPPPPSIWRDQGITMKIAGKLQFNRSLWNAGIQVETNAGIVTLRGTVPSKALADEAEKIAAAVYGVHGVKNEIKVSP